MLLVFTYLYRERGHHTLSTVVDMIAVVYLSYCVVVGVAASDLAIVVAKLVSLTSVARVVVGE